MGTIAAGWTSPLQCHGPFLTIGSTVSLQILRSYEQVRNLLDHQVFVMSNCTPRLVFQCLDGPATVSISPDCTLAGTSMSLPCTSKPLSIIQGTNSDYHGSSNPG